MLSSVDSEQPTGQPDMEQGLLDLSIELSTRDITAGNEFALFVLVKNPFRKPVWVREVNVSLPSELKLADEDGLLEQQEEIKARYEIDRVEAQQELEQIQGKLDALQNQLVELTNASSGTSDSKDIQQLAERVGMQVLNMKEDLKYSGLTRTSMDIRGATIDRIKIGADDTHLHIEGDSDQHYVNIGEIEILEPWLIHQELTQTRTVKLKSSLPDNTPLNPGGTAIYTAILNVRKALTFTPSKYRLQFYVNYGFGSEALKSADDKSFKTESIFTNSIAHELSIRPSVNSLIYGSTAGGLVGSLARLLQIQPESFLEWGISIGLALILSGIAVIFMARKSDTQSFISVEDFWGGLLVGFLVGYTGTSFFENLTGVATPTP